MRPEVEKILTSWYCSDASATAAAGARYGFAVAMFASPLEAIILYGKSSRSARLAGGNRPPGRAEDGAWRGLEPGARRDQRAEREEGRASRAAVRRDRRLPEGLSRPHLQHEQPRAPVLDPAPAGAEDA